MMKPLASTPTILSIRSVLNCFASSFTANSNASALPMSGVRSLTMIPFCGKSGMSRMKYLRFMLPPCIVLCRLETLEALRLLQSSSLVSTLHPQHQQRRRNVDGGVGARDNAHQQRCREVANWSSAHHKQHQHGKECGEGCVERAHPCLSDCSVCELIERLFSPIPQLLTGAVHDHDAILHRVGNDREERANKRCVERNPENGQDSECNEDIMHLSLIHISEPTRLGMSSYAVFCLKKKKQ